MLVKEIQKDYVQWKSDSTELRPHQQIHQITLHDIYKADNGKIHITNYRPILELQQIKSR